MEDKFIEYFKLIGITKEVYLDRIETIMKVQSELCQEEIIDVYVDEYINEDGTREYQDLSLFSAGYSFGAHQFLTNDKFSIIALGKKIFHVVVKEKNYDFKHATSISRLIIDMHYDMGASGTYRASQENCDALKQIYFKYIIPNLME